MLCQILSKSRQRRFYTKKLYTQTLLHSEAFTHRSFYTQTLLHTEAFKIAILPQFLAIELTCRAKGLPRKL